VQGSARPLFAWFFLDAPQTPNNGLTGTFSTLNSYSRRLFRPILPERVL
jgi:hypothetical protein